MYEIILKYSIRLNKFSSYSYILTKVLEVLMYHIIARKLLYSREYLDKQLIITYKYWLSYMHQ